jgi:ADP-ribose pyrophosphatase
MKKPRRKVIYRGTIFNVEEWTEPSGSRFARVKGNHAVAILPMLKNGRILLERQYRHALDRHLYEIPAGLMNKGEKPEAAAIRELEEETGYLAQKLTHMFDFYGSPGSYTQLLHVYLAENLKKTKKHMDADEIIETMEVKFEDAIEMIEKNEIEDGKTIAGILFYDKFRKT